MTRLARCPAGPELAPGLWVPTSEAMDISKDTARAVAQARQVLEERLQSEVCVQHTDEMDLAVAFADPLGLVDTDGVILPSAEAMGYEWFWGAENTTEGWSGTWPCEECPGLENHSEWYANMPAEWFEGCDNLGCGSWLISDETDPEGCLEYPPMEHSTDVRHSTEGCDTNFDSRPRAENRTGQYPGIDHRQDLRIGRGHSFVPRSVNLVQKYANRKGEAVTTLMLRNIPNAYTRRMLMSELDTLGFQGKYDFVYLPIDSTTQWNVGYAFVNLEDEATAKKLMRTMDGHQFQHCRTSKKRVAQISPAHIQGIEKNLEHLRSSAVLSAQSWAQRPWFRRKHTCARDSKEGGVARDIRSTIPRNERGPSPLQAIHGSGVAGT